ncbi:hypothetical protein [Phyllobacterium sp. 22552]|uniref:hypothetical protein n=1 Tax=Phyllobacterium sp. 22552 TaxID=3453941 RepID=UPI003F841E8B
MGVIGIDDEGVVWGASSRFIGSMLSHFVRISGGKPYLVKFQEMFEYRYNAIDLMDVSVDEMAEFRGLVDRYICERGYAPYVTSDADDEIIKDMLVDLVSLIDVSITKRRDETTPI